MAEGNYKSIIFVGISFLIAAIIQLTVYYYQNTLETIPFYYNLLVFISISMSIIILLAIVESNIKRNKLVYSCFIIFCLSIIGLVFIFISNPPRAIITYSFKCPSSLDRTIDLTIQNSGQIYGSVLFSVIPLNENVTITLNGLNSTFWTKQRLSPHRIYNQPIILSFESDYKNFNGDNITIFMKVSCENQNDCQTFIFTGNVEICFYTDNKDTVVRDFVLVRG